GKQRFCFRADIAQVVSKAAVTFKVINALLALFAGLTRSLTHDCRVAENVLADLHPGGDHRRTVTGFHWDAERVGLQWTLEQQLAIHMRASQRSRHVHCPGSSFCDQRIGGRSGAAKDAAAPIEEILSALLGADSATDTF